MNPVLSKVSLLFYKSQSGGGWPLNAHKQNNFWCFSWWAEMDWEWKTPLDLWLTPAKIHRRDCAFNKVHWKQLSYDHMLNNLWPWPMAMPPQPQPYWASLQCHSSQLMCGFFLSFFCNALHQPKWLKLLSKKAIDTLPLLVSCVMIHRGSKFDDFVSNVTNVRARSKASHPQLCYWKKNNTLHMKDSPLLPKTLVKSTPQTPFLSYFTLISHTRLHTRFPGKQQLYSMPKCFSGQMKIAGSKERSLALKSKLASVQRQPWVAFPALC